MGAQDCVLGNGAPGMQVAASSPVPACRGGGGARPGHGAVRGSVAGCLCADSRAVAGQPARLEVKERWRRLQRAPAGRRQVPLLRCALGPVRLRAAAAAVCSLLSKIQAAPEPPDSARSLSSNRVQIPACGLEVGC